MSARQITVRPGDSPRSMTPTNAAGVGRPPSSDTSAAPAAPAEASHPRVGQGDGEERAARGRHSRARLEHGGNPVGTPIATNAVPAFQPGAVRRRSVATADRWSGRRGEELSGPENGCETAREHEVQRQPVKPITIRSRRRQRQPPCRQLRQRGGEEQGGRSARPRATGATAPRRLRRGGPARDRGLWRSRSHSPEAPSPRSSIVQPASSGSRGTNPASVASGARTSSRPRVMPLWSAQIAG